jgi:hypothetical protein
MEDTKAQTPLDRRLAAQKALIPKHGFSLVGVDTFE